MPTQSRAERSSPYSSGLTRSLVMKADEVLEALPAIPALETRLDDVVQRSAELADGERRELQAILQLMRGAGVTPGGSGTVVPQPGTFELTPSDDEMFLTLSVRPPICGGAPVTAEHVLERLKEMGVSRGVDLQSIAGAAKQVIEHGEEVSDVVAVRGRPCEPGEDAKVERFARRLGEAPVEAVEDRLLDRAAETPLTCQADDQIIKYHPPKPGSPGYTALGKTLPPAAPQDVEPIPGRYVRTSGRDCFAEVSGVVVFDGLRVEVRKALIVSHDVLGSSQPIDFDGDVHVRGAVRSGAVVRATGNIVIDGPVEAAEIVSREGDVVLRSGVTGRDAAVVEAGRDVVAKFAEHANVFAQNDIRLQVGSLHSRLIAGHAIDARQGKGRIAGGDAMAGERLDAKQLGTAGSIRTVATVGLSLEVMQKMRELDQERARIEQRRGEADAILEQIDRAVGDPKKLKPRELETYLRLRELRLVAEVQVRQLMQDRREMLLQGALAKAGEVCVFSEIEAGVEVRIGSATHEPPPQRGPCTFTFDEATNRIAASHRR